MRVGGFGHIPEERSFPAEEGRRDFGARRDQLAGGMTAGKDDGFGRDMRFGQFEANTGLMDGRELAFLEKVREKLGDARAEGDAALEDGKEPRLLAVAGDVPRQLAEVQAPLDPDRAEAAAMAGRIERALSAVLADPRQSSFSLKLDLPDAGGGIAGLTVSLSPTSIEVVLARTAGEPSIDYLQAAQLLADRLQARFSRRVVRVLEVEAQPPARPSDGLEAISRLLANPGSRS